MDEFNLAYIGLAEKEKKYYTELLLNIKDLNGVYSLLQLYMKKEKADEISFSGIVYKGEENKTIVGNIYIEDDEIIIDTQVTIVDSKKGSKVYTTLDRIKKINSSEVVPKKNIY